ncbi:MAG: hypothetical protein ACRENA_03400 [Vulcanimicrobiaceae bacterium]
MNVTAWVIIANVLYLASYVVHDILWLRILTVIAALLVIPYYYLQPSPLWVPIEWNFLFIAINIYWIIRLILERRPVHLTAEQQRLRDLSFPSLTPREAFNLFKTGIWETLEPGMSLVEHDRAHSRFSVILTGTADVLMHGVKVDELGEGQFVGEIDTQADEAVDIDVLLRTRARVMCWDRAQLRVFLKKRPDVSFALERSVGLQLRERLDTAMENLRSHPAPNA